MMTKYTNKAPETIQAMFGTIAPFYDRTNAFLSFGLHQRWNKRLVQSVLRKNTSSILLDLCCGTGEIGLEWLKEQKAASQTYFLDFCPEMLTFAEQKALEQVPIKHRVQFIQADAQEIPLPERFVDVVTISYGIRNVADSQKCFKDVFRVLKEGGTLGILELTEPKNPFLKRGHCFYLKHLVPLIGGWISSNYEAYRYLSTSIPNFIKPKELTHQLNAVGFSSVQSIPLLGGVATLLLGKKN